MSGDGRKEPIPLFLMMRSWFTASRCLFWSRLTVLINECLRLLNEKLDQKNGSAWHASSFSREACGNPRQIAHYVRVIRQIDRSEFRCVMRQGRACFCLLRTQGASRAGYGIRGNPHIFQRVRGRGTVPQAVSLRKAYQAQLGVHSC